MLNNLRYILIIVTLLTIMVSSCKREIEDKPFFATPGLEDASFQYPIVRMETTQGTIFLWLYYQTPKHRENFIKLVTDGFYDGLTFHRVIDGFVIQGGDPDGNGSGGPGYTIAAEICPQIVHNYGALASARTADNVNPERRSSGSQFYIVENTMGANFLDQQYSVFGTVIQGMDIVEAIAEVETGPGDRPTTDVVMTKVDTLQVTKAQLLADYNFEIPF